MLTKTEQKKGRGGGAYMFDISLHMCLEPLCSVIAVVNESDLRCVLCNVLAIWLCCFKTEELALQSAFNRDRCLPFLYGVKFSLDILFGVKHILLMQN